MKIFNLDSNYPKSIGLKDDSSVVIATLEEWRLMVKAVNEYAASHPKEKKFKEIKRQIDEFLACC